MAIIRVPKVTNYTVMSNHHLTDRDLSFKAKGLMSYMLSRPDDWDFTIAGLSRLNKDGRDAIGRIIQEIESHGYLERIRRRPLRIAAMLLLFNTAAGLMMLSMAFVFNMTEAMREYMEMTRVMLIAFVILANITMLIYDRLLNIMMAVYRHKMRKWIFRG